jgi:hypothetical protein
MKDKCSTLESNLKILLKSCNDIISEGKQEGDKVVISSEAYSQLKNQTEQIRGYFQEQD